MQRQLDWQISAICLAAICLLLPQETVCLSNGLALVPPMGWMAWARFTCDFSLINEALFESTARHLDEDGFAQLGYEHVKIDDCWSEKLREPISDKLVVNASLFPSGMLHLSQQLHSRNLKLGLYGDCGESTCARYPAQLRPGGANLSNNFFAIDAKTLEEWQIDSFKLDGCFIDPEDTEKVCPKFALELAKLDRPILLTCEWPFYMMYARTEPDWSLAARACNTWRYFDDIEDSWHNIVNLIKYTIRHQGTIVKHHGPSHWFDPDQLVIGNFGLSRSQEWAQMAIWSLWSAPLFMSNNLAELSEQSRQILQHKPLIEVDQDLLGVMGLMVRSIDDRLFAFVKPVMPISSKTLCPSFVVLYLNLATLGSGEKVSMKVRDLLLEAPISIAAIHQIELLAMGPTGWPKDSEQFKLLSEGPQIDFFGCLKKLKESFNFSAHDLISNEKEQDLSLDQELQLLVEPSSVRVIKLTETI